MSDDVVIVSAARTPVGSFNGAFATMPAHDLGAIAIKAALERAGIEPGRVSEVIMGQILTAAQGQNPARQASIAAGIPVESPAWGVNQLCGSGLRTVALGYQALLNGNSEIVVAGGQESMSMAPHAQYLRGGTKMGPIEFVDTMIKDGLWDAFNGYHMGNTAENVAKQYQITRAQQDEFAVASQNKAEVAQKAGKFESGDVFDPERLAAARRRLELPPAFATVDVGPPRPPPAPFADVEVLLAEQKPWRFELGIGYDTALGVSGYLELSHDNLFGTARSAGIRIKEAIGGEAIERLDHVDLIYREPWIPGTPWQGQIELYAERSENLGYDLERVGFLAWIGDDLLNPRGPRIFRSQLRYRLEAARVSNVSPDLQAQGIEPGTERIGSLTPVGMWDFRDDRFNPRRGSLHRASLETAHPALGGSVEFTKAELSTSWFFSWLPPTVFAVSGRLGLAGPFGGTQSLPIQDRFFTGGSTSVRGFPENRLGPRDAAGNPVGGEALAVLSAEWRFPLWRWVSGAVFIDAGTVTPEVDDLSFSAFKSGAGAGLRVATPVGPIRFDAAYALQPIPGEDRLQLYLTVGFPF